MADPSTPIQPVFTRRKRVTKRRQRTTISPPGSPAEDANNAPISAFRNTQLRRAAIPKSNKRRGLCPPPTVSGYDIPTPEAASVSGADYSAASLAKLRKQNSANAPKREPVGLEKNVRESNEKVGTNLANRVTKEWVSTSIHGGDSLKGASGKPDPFSAEWRRGATRDFGKLVDEDGDAVIVDDYAEIDEHVAHISMKDVDGLMKGVQMETGRDESDGEWEREQLRRSGHVSKATEDFALNGIDSWKARRIIREEEEDLALRASSGVESSLEAGLEKARAAKIEWMKKVSHLEEKEKRLLDAQKKSREEGREIDRSVEAKKKELAFYDQLATHVDDLCDMLKEKYAQILEYREQVLNRMRKEVEIVINTLHGGPDEFGRTRSMALPEIEEGLPFSEGLTNPLEDVEEDIRSMTTLIDLFVLWKRDYPADYAASFADTGLGKLVGTLALASEDDALQWARVLSDKQLRAAVNAFEASLYVSLLIRCRWRPRESNTMEGFLQVIARVVTVQTDNDLVATAFRERALMELRACLAVQDWHSAELCLHGVLAVVRLIRTDVGMLEVLKEFDKGRNGMIEALEVRNSIRWVADGAGGLANAESREIARMLSERRNNAADT